MTDDNKRLAKAFVGMIIGLGIIFVLEAVRLNMLSCLFTGQPLW